MTDEFSWTGLAGHRVSVLIGGFRRGGVKRVMVSRTWPQQIPGEAIWRFSMQENILAASALPRTHTGGVYSAAPDPVASPEVLAVHCPRTDPTPLSALWASSFVPRPTVVVVVKLLNKMQHEEPRDFSLTSKVSLFSHLLHSPQVD